MIKLFFLYFRAEKFRLFIWLTVLVGLMVLVAGELSYMYSDSKKLSEFVTLLDIPSMVAMCGIIFGKDNFQIANACATEMFVFMLLGIMIMNVIMVTRYTRQDEESGNLEILRSKVISRSTPTFLVALLALVTNAVIALFCSLPLSLFHNSFTFTGNLIFGLAIFTAGLFASGIAFLFSQIFGSSKAVKLFSIALIFIMYIMRAVGDVNQNSLSYISPIGLLLQTQVYVKNYFWPVAIVFSITFILITLSLIIQSKRDLGWSIIKPSGGKINASPLLSGQIFARLVQIKPLTFLRPIALIFRVNSVSIFGWLIGDIALALSYGSLMGSISGFVKGNDVFKQILQVNDGHSIVESFTSFINIVMALVVCIASIIIMQKMVRDEKNALAVHVLARFVSRTAYFIAHVVIVVKTALITLLITGIVFWLTANLVIPNEHIEFVNIVGQLMWYFLAVLFVIGLACLSVGQGQSWFGGICWGYIVYAFFLIYIEGILKPPDIIMNSSIFHLVPNLLDSNINYMSGFAMGILGIILIIVGGILYNRRDIMEK